MRRKEGEKIKIFERQSWVGFGQAALEGSCDPQELLLLPVVTQQQLGAAFHIPHD